MTTESPPGFSALQLLTPADVAGLLRVTTRTVRRLTATGKLRAVRNMGPKAIRYRAEDVAEFQAGEEPAKKSHPDASL